MAKDGFDYALTDDRIELWSLAEAILSCKTLEAAQAAARDTLENCKEDAVSITCRTCRKEVPCEDRESHRADCTAR